MARFCARIRELLNLKKLVGELQNLLLNEIKIIFYSIALPSSNAGRIARGKE